MAADELEQSALGDASGTDETVSDRGQRLVAVPPERRKRGRPPGTKNKPRTTEFQSIDDVLEKHRGAPVHTPYDEVPPDEPDPAKRAQGTVGPIVLTPEAYDPDVQLPEEVVRVAKLDREPPPDLSDGTLRTLEDLNARFDFDGSGQYYIMVTRQKPMQRNGVLTHGRMRNITTALSWEDFCGFYGGGQYQLIVYGPPARGTLIDPVTGRPRPKALSKAIQVVVPYEGEGAREPNPLASLDANAVDDALSGGTSNDLESALIRRRTNNLADAKMYDTKTQKELIMDERAREDRRKEADERRREEVTALGAVKETAQQTIAMLRDQITDLQEQVRHAANGKSGGAEVADAMAKMVEAMGPRRGDASELQRMKESYEERLKNLSDTHAARVKDIDERHARQLEDRERSLMREKEDAIRRADEQARIAQQQLAMREQQLTADRDREREDARKERERAHADHQRDLELLKKEHERDITRQKEHYENLLAVERSTTQRDRESLKDSLGTKAELLKATVESELRTANAEVARLRADNDRLKSELDKKSNLPKQIEEFERAAGAMGLVRDDGGAKDEAELDWKQTLIRLLPTVAEKLPDIIKNAGDAVALSRGGRPVVAAGRVAPPGVARALAPMPSGRPPAYPVTHVPPIAPGAWATEDAAEPDGAPVAYQPVALPAAVVPAAPEPRVPAASLPPSAPPPVAPPAPPAAVRPVAPAPASAPGAPLPVAAPPPAPETPPAIQVSDADILKFAPVIESWLASGEAPPEQYAAEMLAVQPEIRLIADALSPESVAAVLSRNGRGNSPLVRRDGQRFLARFRAAIQGAPTT